MRLTRARASAVVTGRPMTLSRKTGTRLRVLGGLIGVFLVFGTLVEVLGSMTWHLSPRDPKAIEEATAFQSVLSSLVKTEEVGMASVAPLSPAKPAVALVSTRQPVGAHRVAEWPVSKGRAFNQSPMLTELVARGDLPPVSERLPQDPLVIVPPEQNGPYGGTWPRLSNGPKDIGILAARFAYDGLVRWGPMGNTVVPNLAVRWTVEDNAKTFTFWLRKGVRWSDGHPFTAEDIEFWHQDVLSNKDITPVIARDFKRDGKALTFEKLDDYTVRFRFASPNGLFLKALASGRGYEMVRHAKHFMKNYHPRYTSMENLERMTEERGFDLWTKLFNDVWGWRTIETPRLWPWVLKDPPPARPAVLVRNPYYWKVDPEGNQLPYIDRMTFEIYDAETINFKAINGEMGMQGRHLSYQNYPLFMEGRNKGGYRVVHWINPGMGSHAIALNLNHADPVMKKIIHDRRFRIALSHAINRNELSEADYFGLAEPRQVAPLPTSPYYSESFERAYLKYNPVLANQLLDEMGLAAKDKSGHRLRPDGDPIVIRLETTSLDNRVLELVSGYWTAVGVRTEIKEEARQLFYERKKGLLHDGAIWGAGNGQSPLVDPRFHVPFSDESIHAIDYARWFRTDGKRGEKPPPDILRCIELYREIERTPSEARQVELYKEILELNQKNLWVIGTVGGIPQIFLVRNDFRNVPDVAMGGWIFRTPGNTAMECYSIDPG